MTNTSKPYAHFHKMIGRYRHRFDLDLSKTTAICGPNQTYKTTIGHNYRLGVNGKIPNLETHRGADLCAGTPWEATGFTNELHSVDGIATFQCPAKGDTVLQPFTGRLAALEPFRNDLIISDMADKIFSPKSELGRESFIRAFGERILLEAPEHLTVDQMAIWNKGLEALVTSGVIVKGRPVTARYLADVTEWLRKELNDAGTKVDRAKSKLEGARELTREYNSGANSQVEVTRLRALLTTVEKWAAYQTYQAAEAILARADATVKLQRVSAIRDWLVITQSPKLKAPMLPALPCPLCKGAVKTLDMAALIKAFETQTELRTREAAGITTYAVEQARQNRLKALAVLGGEGFEAPEEPGTDAGTAESIRAKLAGLTRVGSNSSASLAGLALAVTQAEEYYTHVQTLKTALGKHSVKVMEALVTYAYDFMADRMDGVEPHLAVGPKNIEWGVIGRQRKVSPFKQTSGRERGLLMSAGAQALAKTDFRVVVIDDDALGVFDADNIVQFARVLATAAGKGELTQVLFTWNRLAELMILANEGWLVLNTTQMVQ